MKKAIAALMIILTLSSSFSFAIPVQAQGPVTEVGPNLFNSTRQVLKDFLLNKLPIKIAKKLLDKMTDSVVVWAAGGFKKEGPAFISNFKDYAKNTAIETGTLLIDDLVASGEKYSSDKLTAQEKTELAKCTESQRKYDVIYDLIRYGLLKAGIDIGYGAQISLEKDGAQTFNNYLMNRGYPAYVLGPGQVNEIALKDFIEGEIMGKEDVYKLATTSIPVEDFATMKERIKTADRCKKTLFLKVAGLTYTNDLVKFVGKTYRAGRQGSASKFGVPNFDNFGQAYKKSLSDNWKEFQTDASRGGWTAWGETAKLQNTPWGAKYLAQAELSNNLAEELGAKTAELQRSGGFFDKGECKEYKEIKTGGGTEQVCTDYQANTPGSTIREALNKRVLQQYDQLNNINDWSQLLLTTGVKLVSGVFEEGVLPLANNAIDKGLSCLAGSCQEDAFGQSNVASSQTITNSGNGVALDDIVDIKSVLYGPLILEKDQNSNVVYERVDTDTNRIREKRDKMGRIVEYVARATKDGPTNSGIEVGDVVYKIKEVYKINTATNTPELDIDGKKIIDKYVAKRPNGSPYENFGTNGESPTLEPSVTIDYSHPQYAYEFEVDVNNNPTDVVKYETHPLTGAYIFDANGKKVPKYKRDNGSIFLADQLQSLLTAQYNFVRGPGVRMLMDLDHALPGPDLGWDTRLKDKTQAQINETNGPIKNAKKEIYEKIKRTFEDAFSGTMVNDPFDVVMVLDGSQEIFGNPQYTFKDYHYPVLGPGTLKIASNGDVIPQDGITADNYKQYIDRTFPKKMSLTRADRTDPETFNVAWMNTHAGMWFNPATDNPATPVVEGQVEAVGNIPDAQDMRELTLAAQTQFKSAVDATRRRGSDLRTVQVKLKELQRRYESLPYLSPTSTLEDRVERGKKEDEIAYEISLIRDKLPIYDEVAEIKNQIKDILVTYDRMGEMVEGTDKYRTRSGYSTRFGDLQQYRGTDLEENTYKGAVYYAKSSVEQTRYHDLFLKDKMGILYCGFQDHSLLNNETPAQKKPLLEGLVDSTLGIGLSVIGNGVGSLFGFGSTTNSGYYTTSGNKGKFMMFGGNSYIDGIKSKWLESGTRMRDTFNYRAPYRCYETSVICNNSDAACNSFSWECPYSAGHNQPDESFLLAAIPMGCNSVYTSSLADYLELIDPDAQ